MALDSWMPIGLTLPDGEQVRIALQEGLNWQIYESKAGSRILVVKELLANRWIESGLVDTSQLQIFSFSGDSYFEYSSSKEYVLSNLAQCNCRAEQCFLKTETVLASVKILH